LPEDKETLVIAYCGGPKCAAWCEAADWLAAKGYTNVKHYSAGIKGWIAKEGGSI
jgi:rhodanese-related sulfurtransferase